MSLGEYTSRLVRAGAAGRTGLGRAEGPAWYFIYSQDADFNLSGGRFEATCLTPNLEKKENVIYSKLINLFIYNQI